MLDALGQDYVRTARAKGVRRLLVIFKHTLRNALIPVVTYVGPMVAYILTGSLVVESVFTIGGLGSKFVTSKSNRDYTMIMGNDNISGGSDGCCQLVSDLIYKAVDPRISFD
jgi:oligopeptide transport system permease protein